MKPIGLKQIIASAGFAGYLPGAPGTWGSLVAVIVWFGLQYIVSPLIIMGLTIILFFVGVWVSAKLSKHDEEEDPSYIVIDEWVGQWIPLWFIPIQPVYILLAFGLFRAFDIAKPWPIRIFDEMSGGWGIMLDDIAAGVYALIILEGIQFIV